MLEDSASGAPNVGVAFSEDAVDWSDALSVAEVVNKQVCHIAKF
jgi:hypothetical protein